MSGVMVQQKKPGMMSQFAPIAGQIAGTAIGGPVGGAVGGMIGGKLAGGDKGQAGAVASNAMQRRADNAPPPPSEPVQDLAAANEALAQMPPAYQKQYGPALQGAMMRAQQNRSMA